MVREAEVTADNIVSQAIEQANRIESKISELRTMRRDLQLKFRNTLDLFQRILEAEMEDERTTATIRTLPRKRKSS
jgi:vacuolar-type H+-ATPase subunit E/Vma4